jgi:hypothetical protein
MEGQAPEEIQVIPYGVEIQTPKGPFTLDEKSASVVISDSRRTKIKWLLITNTRRLPEPKRRLLAGLQSSSTREKKEYGRPCPDGQSKQYNENREYRYVSPVFLKRISDNRVLRLINVALTNQPNIDGMVPLINKAGLDLKTNIDKEEKSMW